GGGGALVEADVFLRGADEDAPVGPGDEVALAVHEHAAEERRASIEQGDLSADGADGRPPAPLLQEGGAPRPPGGEIVPRGQPALDGTHADDLAAVALQPDSGTARPQTDAQRYAAGDQRFNVTRVAQLCRIR